MYFIKRFYIEYRKAVMGDQKEEKKKKTLRGVERQSGDRGKERDLKKGRKIKKKKMEI